MEKILRENEQKFEEFGKNIRRWIGGCVREREIMGKF